MDDDRDLLAAAGTALFGATWKAELAQALTVDDRSLRRWLQTGEIPPGVWRDVHALMQARSRQLGAVTARLAARMERGSNPPET